MLGFFWFVDLAETTGLEAFEIIGGFCTEGNEGNVLFGILLDSILNDGLPSVECPRV